MKKRRAREKESEREKVDVRVIKKRKDMGWIGGRRREEEPVEEMRNY